MGTERWSFSLESLLSGLYSVGYLDCLAEKGETS